MCHKKCPSSAQKKKKDVPKQHLKKEESKQGNTLSFIKQAGEKLLPDKCQICMDYLGV